MRPGAILINTVRGAIVNESDLVQALLTNRIAGAGLDVFAIEPLPPDSPLCRLMNVVLSPHAAGITPEATEAGLALAIENVFAFLAGHPTNVVVSSMHTHTSFPRLWPARRLRAGRIVG